MKLSNSILPLCVALALVSPLPAQVPTPAPVPPSWTQNPVQGATPTIHNNQPTQDPAERMREDLARKQGLKRQEQARQDARKLLELATELQKELDQTTANSTPAKAAGNADEILKLAKSLKSNLRPL